MSLEIRSGGAIAVDPASLRELADRLGQARGWVDAGTGGTRTAIDRLWWAPILGHACGWQVDQLRHRMVLAAHELDDLAGRIRSTADAYEIVDLMFRVELSWLHHGEHDATGAAERAALEARIREIADADGDAYDEARAVMAAWEEDYGADEQLTGALEGISPAAAAFVRMAALANRGAGTGVIPRGAKLRGSEVRAGATAVSSGAATAPQSLAEATSRIPDSDGAAQIRVEKYTMADGSVQFAVYLAGTSTGERNTFNWPSNVDLYFGKTSPSFTATMAALADAGAKPGDVLHTFGFSQGAMIAARLATEGDYRVQTVVGLGSPVDADLGDDTLSLQLRHRDDPIALLAAGGMPAGTGAPQSVVVERIARPQEGLSDLLMPAHRLDPYVATAGMVDASDDVRVDAFRDALAELDASAVQVEFTEYRAELAERHLVGAVPRRGGSSGGVSAPSSSGDEG